MNHPQPSTSHTASEGSVQKLTCSRMSGSARQLARTQGQARMSAVTLGVGAASVLGAVAIAVTLADSTPAVAETSANPAAMTVGASTPQTSDDGFLSQPHGTGPRAGTRSRRSRTRASRPHVRSQTPSRSALAPRTTHNPPVATSGGS
jgi:hypothetical protein